MTEKQGIDLSTSKGRRQAGGRWEYPVPVWRLLVVFLAVLTVALSAPLAGAFAAPSDDDPAGGGLSPDAATFNPGQESMSARASSTSDPWFVDPGEWYAPLHGPSTTASTVLSGAAGDMSAWFAAQGEWHVAPFSPSAIPSTVLSGAAGDMGAWFTDPGEWHVASFSPSATASNVRPDAAGSYSVLRLAAAESGVEVANTTGLSDAAGSYSVLRLAAAESGAKVASTTRPSVAAGSYGVLRLAAGKDRSAEATLDYSEFRVRMAAGNPPGKASLEPVDAGADDEWLSGAGEYGHLRPAAAEGSENTGADAFDEKGANVSAWFEDEAEWYIAQYGAQVFASTIGSMALSDTSLWQEYDRTAALSDSCMEQQDDPVFGASSAREAEYYDFQCSPKGAAGLIGGGGSHRQ